MGMTEEDKLLRTISTLEDEHRSLDAMISEERVDMLHLQRLKRRKLWLKDEISRLHAYIQPDIIA